jgi:ATP/maltotriose-dependent transcriptional regulator MalT
VFGALDALIVLARCELEFSHLDKSVNYYQQVIDLSTRWRIWPWNFLSEGSIIRIEVVRGKIELASNAITEQRKKLSTFPRTMQLDWMIDMSEAFLRYVIEDFDRADQLTLRLPKIDMVKQLDFNAEVRKNPGKIESVLSVLPVKSSRQQVFKFMSEVHAYSSQENVALKSLRKAVELGSEVGFHESFARQNKLYPLFVKLASQQPTFYLENLVREMTERIQSMNADTGSLEEKLTSRELEILKHLTTGNPISAIAKQLHISQNTMKTHLRNVYRKLGVDGRHSAVQKAQKLLLI